MIKVIKFGDKMRAPGAEGTFVYFDRDNKPWFFIDGRQAHYTKPYLVTLTFEQAFWNYYKDRPEAKEALAFLLGRHD
jgi:hypothetical protein